MGTVNRRCLVLHPEAFVGKGMPIRLLTFFLLLIMLFPTGSFGLVVYQCRLDGQIRQVCCCRDAESKQPSASAYGGQDGCCDFKETGDRPASVEQAFVLLSIESPNLGDLPPAESYFQIFESSWKVLSDGVACSQPRGAQ